RRPVSAEAAALHLWPGLAALNYVGLPLMFQQVFAREAFGDANIWSVGLCAVSLSFAASSAMAFAQVVRAARRGAIPRLWRLVPSACGLACFILALYLADHHIIGLAIWRW
ncbi:MAG: hypothetical protein KC457_16405, partial [Myxococcales bacterium]|nr:hypothetical protein [Myxococcales bacterium]